MASRAGACARRKIPGAGGGGGAEFQKFSFSGSGHSGLDPRTGPIGLKAVIEIIYSDFLFEDLVRPTIDVNQQR